MMNEIMRWLISILVFVGLVAYIDQRGASAIVPLAGSIAVIFAVWMLYEIINTARQRLDAETHKRRGQAELEHARADRQYAEADKIRGNANLIESQTNQVLTSDQLAINEAAAKLVELSIMEYKETGTQILPAHLCGDQLGMDWQAVKDYMESCRWVTSIRRGNEAGTFLTGYVKNLRTLQTLIALASLPRVWRQG